MLDATRIQPGERYAWQDPDDDRWNVDRNVVPPDIDHGDHDFGASAVQYLIVEPERLHEIPIGSTVLNVATGEQFEWCSLRRTMYDDGWNVFTPLLALVATPEDTDA